MNPSELWWTYVPAGVTLKRNIVQQLGEGRCVFLGTSHLPWKEQLLETVKAELQATDSELNWTEISAESLNGQKPLNYLGRFYNVDQIPNEKLIRQNILRLSSCCHVKDIPQNEAQAWIRMAKELFNSREKQTFRLVLELPFVTERGLGKISVVDTKIERFDIYYFALSILARERLSKTFQEYAATLCAELAEGDAERCFALCGHIEAVLRDPVAADEANNEPSKLKQLVCRAQTRSVSPLIDIGRLKLLSMFGARITHILPRTDEYGTEIDDVNKVELRHLFYFSRNDLLTITPTEKEILYCLYNARNAISHLKTLSYDEIQKLFHILESLI